MKVVSTEQQSRWKEILISSCLVLHVLDCLGLDIDIIAQDPNSDMRCLHFWLFINMSLSGYDFEPKSLTCFDITNGRHSICCSAEELGGKPAPLSSSL